MVSAASLSEDEHVISRTTILILSGVLLSLSTLPELGELGFYVFAGSLIGLIAFFALDNVAQQAMGVCLSTGQATAERRLTRHLHATAPVSADLLREQRQLLEWLRRETQDLG